jgi:hypothetical protein
MSVAMSLVSVTMLAYYGKDLRQGVNEAQTAPAAVVESMQQNAGEFWTEAVEVYETMRLLYVLQTGEGGAVEELSPPPEESAAGESEQNQ